MGNLKMTGGVTPNMLPFSATFSPTAVIAAGRIEKLSMDIRSFHEPLLRSVREVMAPSIRENFNTAGRGTWEPLSAATLQIRAKYNNANTDPLVWTGNLRRVASQINIWTITQFSAMIRDLPANVWYGKIHQAGYEGGGSGRSAAGKSLFNIVEDARGAAIVGDKRSSVSPIPARPFVVFQPEDEDNITHVFLRWMSERVMAAWPGVQVG